MYSEEGAFLLLTLMCDLINFLFYFFNLLQMDRGSVEGMQAVLVCGLYEGQEFVRIGYYLNNAYR